MPKGSHRRHNVHVQQPEPSPPIAMVAVSPSSSTTDKSKVQMVSETQGDGSHLASASRLGSPMKVELNNDGLHTDDVVTCQWGDCGVVFTHLPTLIIHIHDSHIGVHKSNYTCEWTSCLRKGLPQTSRFALISHIRSHTGEKPFICTLPECDKSFTRSDALAKHMRLQHNIAPPAPGRGGSRKRKREEDNTQGTSTPIGPRASPAPITNTGGFTTFKVEPTPSEGNELLARDYHSRETAGINGLPKRLAHQSNLHSQHTPSTDVQANEDDDGYTSSSSDVLPPRLEAQFDEETGLVLGRTPAKVMYLLMKAKHKYIREQHELLLEELRMANDEVLKQRAEKENTLDILFRQMLGPEAELLVQSPPRLNDFQVRIPVGQNGSSRGT